MQIQPYLFFEGRAEEAIAFYRAAVGAEVSMQMRYNEAPQEDQSGMSPATAKKIMHASLKIGQSLVMLSDGHCSGNPTFEGVALSLTVASDVMARRAFTALSEGGHVRMPLGKTFFAPQFGTTTDKFGVVWMVAAAG